MSFCHFYESFRQSKCSLHHTKVKVKPVCLSKIDGQSAGSAYDMPSLGTVALGGGGEVRRFASGMLAGRDTSTFSDDRRRVQVGRLQPLASRNAHRLTPPILSGTEMILRDFSRIPIL